MELNYGTLDDLVFPEILYKYRDWQNIHNKRFITLREVYMSSPLQFEDAIDCKNPVRYDLLTTIQKEKYFDRLGRLANPNMTRQERRKQARWRAHSKEFLSKERIAQHQEFYFKEYFKRFGVLSLTAENCLEEMWIKYANNQKGFCIGYNSRILFDYLGGGGKVKYVEQMPILLPEPFMDKMEIREGQIFTKEKKWDFEKEYRTHKFWFNEVGIAERQIKIPKEAFNSVILGENISAKDRLEITKAIKENIGEIPILDQNSVCDKSRSNK